MLLVYTHKITPRLKYIFKHICTRMLGIEVTFTTKIEVFEARNGIKMAYAKQLLEEVFFVKSHDILFEQGLSNIEINVQDWGATKGFFSSGEKSALPFDIFAASFYLLSRYEEYLPHVKDAYGRFLETESMAYKHGFLHQPVVDIWAMAFKKALRDKFPSYTFSERSYTAMPIVEVPCAYRYKLKGVARSVGGAIRDLFSFKFKCLYHRIATVLALQRDPYDTFQYILDKQRQFNTSILCFFLVAQYSTYDKGISPNKKKFIALIKHIADYCRVGLKSSFFAADDVVVLKKEKQRLEQAINTPLQASRQSLSKLNLPEAYRNLIALEIWEDYTMGYPSQVGFRAGTCTPFLFYDLDDEIQTPLKVYPYHVTDEALLKKRSFLDKKELLQAVITEVKHVGGTFVAVFRNHTLGDTAPWKGFRKLFDIVLESANTP